MENKKEFELHNGKGVLYGRYSTDEYNRKYKELYDENIELRKEIIELTKFIEDFRNMF